VRACAAQGCLSPVWLLLGIQMEHAAAYCQFNVNLELLVTFNAAGCV
jgi:hypothetical protein